MKKFYPLIFSLIIGCASWIQSTRHHETPVAFTPTPWFQESMSDFAGASLKAGYSEADLTPSSPQWLAGYAVGRKSKGVRHALRAQCLALEDGRGEKLMLVSLDFLGVLPDFVDGVLRRVHSWPKDRILFSCSHTHSAPDIYGIWGEGIIVVPLFDGKDSAYIAETEANIALAIDAAASGLMPARLRFAAGEAPPDISRGRADNPPPGDIAMLQVGFPGNCVTVFNYALHPDLMEGKYMTPDFVYFLRQRFEALTGGRLVFINGAVGGVQPKSRKDRAGVKTENWLRAREIGEILAQRALDILKEPIVPENSHIEVRRAKLRVALENPRFRLAINAGLIADFLDGEGRGETDVSYVSIGGAQILTAPGELFPGLWREIRSRLTGRPQFLFGLTDVALGYIMSGEDFRSGKHPYHTSMSVGPEIGEELMGIYLKLLDAGK